MTHPDVHHDAVENLRRRAGAPVSPEASVETVPASVTPATATARIKAKARQVATPVVARVRTELDRAASGEVEALRAEVTELRAEVRRLEAEQAAAIAALQEDRR